MFKNIFTTLFFFGNISGSILSITNNINNNSSHPSIYYQINTPHFSLGNKDFPISGNVILSQGCSAFSKIDISEIERLKIHYNATNFIVLVSADASDLSCFLLKFIFDCQVFDWCKGVMVESIDFQRVSSARMWSQFDEHRSQNAYKVPLVEASRQDFDLFKSLVIENRNILNSSQLITLTNDLNPWLFVISSIALLVYFRIFLTITAVVCFIFSIVVLFNSSNGHQIQKKISNRNKLNYIEFFQSQITLKRFCLFLQAISQFFKIFYFSIDPIFSQRVFTYLIAYQLLTIGVTFEIGSNIFLSFTM
eukprot:c16344_g1_i2.p1 GENE.c16344_g1_i2~~c16344_g1_i2.p1  ORF type:complete len:307 (+),score=42.20 c16344_g1_i2:187-1107(+)